ncbi:MAG: hypothetical protein C4522_14865 [Desulfobacteraceae bacterium]|nr:MAG: hypothetical protein C4522_14865 [Desulfobacteraceae bacterium]
MSKKGVKTTSKTSVSGLLLKTTISIPVFVTGLFIHTGEIILHKSIDFLTGEKKHRPAPETTPEIRPQPKTNTACGTLMDTDTVFGMRPYGPKIHIRK